MVMVVMVVMVIPVPQSVRPETAPRLANPRTGEPVGQAYNWDKRTTDQRAGCSNPAKNNVTGRVRLDEKYAARRALTILVKPKTHFARICGVFFAKEMPGSSPAHRRARQAKQPAPQQDKTRQKD